MVGVVCKVHHPKARTQFFVGGVIPLLSLLLIITMTAFVHLFVNTVSYGTVMH